MPHFLNHGNAEFIPPCVEIHFAHISQSPLLLDSDSWGQRSLCPHSSSWNLGANCSPIFWLCSCSLWTQTPPAQNCFEFWQTITWQHQWASSSLQVLSRRLHTTTHGKTTFFLSHFLPSGWAWDFKLLSPLIHPNSAVPQPHLRTGTLKPSLRLSKIKSHLR